MSLLADLIAAESTPAPETDLSDRYRLIKTLGTRNPSRFVYGAEAAREEAQREWEADGIPVMVIRFPPEGLARRQYIVGKIDKKKGAKNA